MAIGSNLNKTDGLTLETSQTQDETLAFAEGSNVEKESLEKGGLTAYIQQRFDRSKEVRYNDEQRWLEAYRNFRGEYGPDVKFTDTEKSQAFIKITKTKVLASLAQIEEILFSGGRFPVGAEASPVPEGIAEAVHIDPKEPVGPSEPQRPATVSRPDILDNLGPLKTQLEQYSDKIKDGPGLTPTAYTWEPAKMAAKKLDKKFQDQLAEANAVSSLSSFAFDLCLFGTGIFKGPTAKDKEYPKWSAEGEYQPVIKTIADFAHVSIWDCYPDFDARQGFEMEDFTQRHRMSKSQLRALKKRPYFRSKSIDLAIKMGPDYQEEYWEFTLRDYRNQPAENTRYEVLEYWGIVDTDLEEIMEMKIPAKYKGMDQVQVNAWICNGQVLRLVFNPFTPARIPYLICPYELNPYSIFGIGVAENMADTQLLMNGFMRMAVDNAVLSSNIIFEIDETNLVPGQDMKVYPGKIFRRQGGMPGQQIFATKFPNVTQECMMMFDKARQLADEATGMPSYAHGVSGIQSVNRTASGMSMMMGAAAQNIKAVVRNIDNYLLVPLGKALFSWNMQFDFDEDFVGDLEIVARGTESLMRNEVRSQKLLQALQLTNNPTDAPWVKRDYLLRELFDSLDIEEDKAVNDPREAGLQAMMIQQMQQAMGIDPNAAGGGGSSASAAPAGNPASMPKPSDSTGTGGGNVQPGNAPQPGQSGFSGPRGSPPARPG